jgi:hypothetical protein
LAGQIGTRPDNGKTNCLRNRTFGTVFRPAKSPDFLVAALAHSGHGLPRGVAPTEKVEEIVAGCG